MPYVKTDIPLSIGRVTNHFNKLCSQVGLQGTVRMDPSDWRTVFDFRNVGKMLIRIRWTERKQEHTVLLEPNESTTLKLSSSIEDTACYPEIKAFRYDNED